MKAKTLLLTAGLAALLGGALPAQAQRGEAEVQRLIDQLNPGSRTRGIRLPSDGGTAPPAQPQGQSQGQAQGQPQGQDRVASPMGKGGVPPSTTPRAAPAASLSATITVLFPTASAVVTPEAARSIDPLGRALTSTELAPYRFRIEGHTDTVGSRESNQQLSEARAMAVRAYLMQRFGVQPDRLEAVGLGEDQPMVRTGDEVPERRNRRVQIVNLGS